MGNAKRASCTAGAAPKDPRVKEQDGAALEPESHTRKRGVINHRHFLPGVAVDVLLEPVGRVRMREEVERRVPVLINSDYT